MVFCVLSGCAILSRLEVRSGSELRGIMAVDAKNILSLEKVRLYRLVRVLAVLILILGILFTD